MLQQQLDGEAGDDEECDDLNSSSTTTQHGCSSISDVGPSQGSLYSDIYAPS